MENNINHQRIRTYGKSFAAHLLNSYFTGNEQIKGEEIPSFCDIKQINYFSLKILFEQWQLEFNQLKSPYFNYESDEVKQASTSFMNVISRNILIGKEDFRPLLEEAVYKTILLIFSPYEYFLQEINQPHIQQITIDELKAKQKYVKINNHLLTAYINRFHDDGIQAVFKEDAIKIFDQVCETIKETPEDFETYQQAFSEVIPLDLNEVYAHPDEGIKDDSVNNESQESKNLNAAFSTQRHTLLDTLGTEQKEAIIDLHEDKPVDGIKKSISINQRFMFENDLFNGDKTEFEMVLNYLDNCQGNQEAMDFIQENYIQKKNWDLEKEEVVEFFEVINKRFPA